MAVDYSNFITEATEALESQEASEIKCRCSISRAYYGLYHLALEYADSVSVPPVSDCSGPVHKNLAAYYQGSYDSDEAIKMKHRRIGYILKQLHENRVKADYKIDKICDKVEAVSHLSRCNQVIQLVVELSAAKAA